MIVLSKVEQIILSILEGLQGDEIASRELRGLLSSRGFRRSAPALVFTMMNLEDKGLIESREEIKVVNDVEVRDRYYQIKTG